MNGAGAEAHTYRSGRYVMLRSMSASVGWAKAFRCGHGHDLPGLAVAIGGTSSIPARCTDGCYPGEASDSDHFAPIRAPIGHRNRTAWRTVDMHRARAHRRYRNRICARQTDNVAQHPEKRSIGLYVYLPGYSVTSIVITVVSPPNPDVFETGRKCELRGHHLDILPTVSFCWRPQAPVGQGLGWPSDEIARKPMY